MTRMLTAREWMQAAENVTAELHSALRTVGITLPSLGVDPVSCTSSYLPPLVELGRCNLDTAQRLTYVLADYAKATAAGHDGDQRQP